MSGKAAENISNEDLDQLLETYTNTDPGSTLPTPRLGLYFVFALVVTALPIHLYLTPMFNLELSKHGLYFAATTIVATFFVTKAHVETGSRTVAKLQKERAMLMTRPRRKMTKEEKEKAEEQQVALANKTTTEAIAYTLFVNNASFLLMFLLTAFALVPWLSNNILGVTEDDEETLQKVELVNYVVSIIGPAALLVSMC